MLEKNDTIELLELFFRQPLYSFHLREVCRALHWSPTKVRSEINKLKRKKLIVESREKNLSLFRSDRESDEFRAHKMLYNLGKAHEIAKIIETDIKDFDAIILFGSARRGEDIENSDFDLCVVGAKEQNIDFKGIERLLNRKVSVIFIESVGMLKKNNKELLNNLINGFVVNGYLKVF